MQHFSCYPWMHILEWCWQKKSAWPRNQWLDLSTKTNPPTYSMIVLIKHGWEWSMLMEDFIWHAWMSCIHLSSFCRCIGDTCNHFGMVTDNKTSTCMITVYAALLRTWFQSTNALVSHYVALISHSELMNPVQFTCIIL